MPSFFNRPASEKSALPSYTSSQGSSSSSQAGSAPSEPPPPYALHITRPPGILGSLLPRRIRSRFLGGASPLSDHPHGLCSQADSPLSDHPHGPSSHADTPSSGPSSDEKPPVAPRSRPCCVQMCPHEIISFERLQRILSLPGFKESYRNLEALAAGPDHELDSYSPNRVCKPRQTKFSGLETFSEYSFSATSLVLNTRWYVPKITKESHCSSRSALQEFLHDLDIKLCPHKSLDDPWVVEVLYRTAHPEERLADPLDQWEVDANFPMEAGGKCETQCQLCSTSFEKPSGCCFLYVTRDLGKGDSPSDPKWLAQCSVAAEEDREK